MLRSACSLNFHLMVQLRQRQIQSSSNNNSAKTAVRPVVWPPQYAPAPLCELWLEQLSNFTYKTTVFCLVCDCCSRYHWWLALCVALINWRVFIDPRVHCWTYTHTHWDRVIYISVSGGMQLWPHTKLPHTHTHTHTHSRCTDLCPLIGAMTAVRKA